MYNTGMAWRIDEAVVHGEIDNRVPGRVIGRIWFMGLDQPVILDLRGNGHRDLAGCRLQFTNPEPRLDDRLRDLNLLQEGSVGDMTAARKVKVPTVSMEEFRRLYKARQPIPTTLANAVYLEWFSSSNGRVVIESSRFLCTISERSWTLTQEEEQSQRQDNQSAMFEFLDDVSGKLEADESQGDKPGEESEEVEEEEERKPMDEFEAERFLQECDRRTDRYMELLDKYEDHPNQDRIIAQAMGWDHMVEEIEEEFGEPDAQDMEAEESSAKDGGLAANQGGSEGGAEEDAEHPLCQRAHALCLRLHQDSKDLGLAWHEGQHDSLNKLHRGILFASGKLAGALNGSEDDPCLEPGITVAWLKRALNFLHEAIDGATTAVEQDAAPKAWAESIRAELFEIRGEILLLMETYRRMIG